MRRLLAVVLTPLALLTGVALLAPTAATAAPSVAKVSIGSPAVYTPGHDDYDSLLAPVYMSSSVTVPVTVTCPATYEGVELTVELTQASTGADGYTYQYVECTGRPVQVPVTVYGSDDRKDGPGSFTLGKARAEAYLMGMSSPQTQQSYAFRQIQIVL